MMIFKTLVLILTLASFSALAHESVPKRSEYCDGKAPACVSTAKSKKEFRQKMDQSPLVEKSIELQNAFYQKALELGLLGQLVQKFPQKRILLNSLIKEDMKEWIPHEVAANYGEFFMRVEGLDTKSCVHRLPDGWCAITSYEGYYGRSMGHFEKEDMLKDSLEEMMPIMLQKLKDFLKETPRWMGHPDDIMGRTNPSDDNDLRLRDYL